MNAAARALTIYWRGRDERPSVSDKAKELRVPPERDVKEHGDGAAQFSDMDEACVGSLDGLRCALSA